MNILSLLPGEYRKSGHKNGGEFSGACPWCGDGGKGRDSDRFRIWPQQGRNGTYWCRMCGRGGDAIKYLMDHDGMEFKAALDHLGLDPAILGLQNDKPLPVGWRPSAAINPAAVWAEKAKKFVVYCHERLLERPEEQQWLADRGIGMDMICKYKLGWNPSHEWREGSAWGLTMAKKSDGKLKKLWLPRGLVIPALSDFSDDGEVIRLRIRQPDQTPRYLVIQGSSREPLCSRPAEAMVVVESELDAILLDGLVGDLVGVVAMGNDTAKPTERLLPVIKQALAVMVALDSDQPRFNPATGGLDIPGGKASRWWVQHFPQAMRLPVVGGKDPGDAYAEGVDLRTWMLAALPPYFHIAAELAKEKSIRGKELAKMQDAACQNIAEASPGPQNTIQEQEISWPDAQHHAPQHEDAHGEVPDDAGDVVESSVRTVTLMDGRQFCVTADRDQWEKLVAAGEVVFSEWELKRMLSACGTMDHEERLAAALLVLDVKEVFGHAWIRRGEVVAAESI